MRESRSTPGASVAGLNLVQSHCMISAIDVIDDAAYWQFLDGLTTGIAFLPGPVRQDGTYGLKAKGLAVGPTRQSSAMIAKPSSSEDVPGTHDQADTGSAVIPPPQPSWPSVPSNLSRQSIRRGCSFAEAILPYPR